MDESAPGHDHGANLYETRGSALCELIEHLPTTGWSGHGGNGCEVLVTIDLDSLLSGLGSAGLDTGIAITAGHARRLACDAGLLPAVLDGSSTPLDLGRSRRLHSRGQRRALALMHHTCAVAGCTRPSITAGPTTPASTSDDGPTGTGPSTDAREGSAG